MSVKLHLNTLSVNNISFTRAEWDVVVVFIVRGRQAAG